MAPLRNPSRGETGSAYIVTLLALVVLTILALTLTLVTQSEVQTGGNEKTVNRLFYSTDALLTLAAPKLPGLLADTGIDTIYANRVKIGTGSNIANTADRVMLGPPAPMSFSCADRSDCSEKAQYFETVHMATAVAQRIAWEGNDLPGPTTPVEILGSKTLEMNILAQPTEKPLPESYPGLRRARVPPP